MRYAGQGFDTSVVVPEHLNAECLQHAFETNYRTLYGRIPDQPIRIVALRLSVSAPMPGSETPLRVAPRGDAGPRGERRIWFPEAGRAIATPIFARAALGVGTQIVGPAILEEDESTLIVGPGGIAVVHSDGSIIVDVPPA
jgi:N-methylhydantoinase A